MFLLRGVPSFVGVVAGRVLPVLLLIVRRLFRRFLGRFGGLRGRRRLVVVPPVGQAQDGGLFDILPHDLVASVERRERFGAFHHGDVPSDPVGSDFDTQFGYDG